MENDISEVITLQKMYITVGVHVQRNSIDETEGYIVYCFRLTFSRLDRCGIGKSGGIMCHVH